MSISSVAASIAAIRTQPTPAASGAARPATTPDQNGRAHGHYRGTKADLVTASVTQSANAVPGGLLNTLI